MPQHRFSRELDSIEKFLQEDMTAPKRLSYLKAKAYDDVREHTRNQNSLGARELSEVQIDSLRLAAGVLALRAIEEVLAATSSLIRPADEAANAQISVQMDSLEAVITTLKSGDYPQNIRWPKKNNGDGKLQVDEEEFQFEKHVVEFWRVAARFHMAVVERSHWRKTLRYLFGNYSMKVKDDVDQELKSALSWRAYVVVSVSLSLASALVYSLVIDPWLYKGLFLAALCGAIFGAVIVFVFDPRRILVRVGTALLSMATITAAIQLNISLEFNDLGFPKFSFDNDAAAITTGGGIVICFLAALAVGCFLLHARANRIFE
ncbi:hypothetical protein [Yoonia sp. R2-816]|uniref:hypothetical protein n=1 Tax=Yoonia sp. R2-816 TaxID=3342638 RepID=UPI00372C634A